TIATVMLKLSASLAWSSTKGMVSFFISQITNGPTKQPMLPAQPAVTRPPTIADRCANIAHCRCSAGMPPSTLAGAGLMSFIAMSPPCGATRRLPALSGRAGAESSPGDGHAPDQHRADSQVRTGVGLGAHGLDRGEPVAQVASDGDGGHRRGDHAVHRQEAGG